MFVKKKIATFYLCDDSVFQLAADLQYELMDNNQQTSLTDRPTEQPSQSNRKLITGVAVLGLSPRPAYNFDTTSNMQRNRIKLQQIAENVNHKKKDDMSSRTVRRTEAWLHDNFVSSPESAAIRNMMAKHRSHERSNNSAALVNAPTNFDKNLDGAFYPVSKAKTSKHYRSALLPKTNLRKAGSTSSIPSASARNSARSVSSRASNKSKTLFKSASVDTLHRSGYSATTENQYQTKPSSFSEKFCES